jgi:hypothetical protein
MIVRDEAEYLSNCLESVRGIFDEIVVVENARACAPSASKKTARTRAGFSLCSDCSADTL